MTPTKTGQFVTIWKRDKKGITCPFNCTDNIDVVIIASRMEDRIGLFVFPQSVLLAKGIMTGNNKQGKRGIRVYPPWDKPTNMQAAKTQSRQVEYFMEINNEATTFFCILINPLSTT